MPLVAQLGDHLEQLVDDGRCETQRRLVEQQDARAAPSGRGRWPASAARRRRAGRHGRARRCLQAREAIEQRVDLGLDIAIAARVGAEQEIVAHAELREHLAAFRHEGQRRRAAMRCASSRSILRAGETDRCRTRAAAGR